MTKINRPKANLRIVDNNLKFSHMCILNCNGDMPIFIGKSEFVGSVHFGFKLELVILQLDSSLPKILILNKKLNILFYYGRLHLSLNYGL